ncbi:hypothetical protein CEXT_486461 [Caerostris extrusa]|uniref:Uncharacterized protein n=1 Tax=Caerostris extrusa TaxID=172846 RepID=A0AAV4SSB8_CAEEX|nr:hypothetical protein CEXT_486461 [Caerostris extrusa]
MPLKASHGKKTIGNKNMIEVGATASNLLTLNAYYIRNEMEPHRFEAAIGDVLFPTPSYSGASIPVN